MNLPFVIIDPLDGSKQISINVPGSKSYSIRALLIAAMMDTKPELINLLDSDDTRAMKKCLDDLESGKTDLFTNESGVATRFMTALCCCRSGIQTIGGAPSLNKRPIGDLVDALRSLGADIEYIENEGFPPVRVRSELLTKRYVKVRGDTSSQFLSALLLIAPSLENGLEIEVDGKLISKPYVDMTIDIMGSFGVAVEVYDYEKFLIKPQKYDAENYRIESDYSSAGYFFAAAALTNCEISVENLDASSLQADKDLLPILQKMGSNIAYGKSSITVKGSSLNPIDVDMSNCPDQAMTVAVLCAFAEGKSKITGIQSLRLKETERIKALENELAKMNIETESDTGSLIIYGGKPKPATIDSYGDHRIAMSFAVAGAIIDGIKIYNPSAVNKTFPNFWNEFSKITNLGKTSYDYSKIVLTGMRGSGKTTVGKIISKKLGLDFVDVDEFIEQKNKINIKESVRQNGWGYFRELESNAIEHLSRLENIVIATGGGAILKENNVDNLRKDSVIFFLKTDPQLSSKRIKTYDKLPALTNFDSVEAELLSVWEDRKQKYFGSCDFVVDTEKLNPDQVTNEILAKINAGFKND